MKNRLPSRECHSAPSTPITKAYYSSPRSGGTLTTHGNHKRMDKNGKDGHPKAQAEQQPSSIDSLLQRINELQVLQTMLHQRVGQLEGHICNELQEKAALMAENQRLQTRLQYYEERDEGAMVDPILYPLTPTASVERDHGTGVGPLVFPPVPFLFDSPTTKSTSDVVNKEEDATQETESTWNDDNVADTPADTRDSLDNNKRDAKGHGGFDSDDGEDVRSDYIPAALKAHFKKSRAKQHRRKQKHSGRRHGGKEVDQHHNKSRLPQSPTIRRSPGILSPKSVARLAAQGIEWSSSKTGQSPCKSPGKRDNDTSRHHSKSDKKEDDCEAWIMQQHEYNLELLVGRRRDMHDWNLGNFEKENKT